MLVGRPERCATGVKNLARDPSPGSQFIRLGQRRTDGRASRRPSAHFDSPPWSSETKWAGASRIGSRSAFSDTLFWLSPFGKSITPAARSLVYRVYTVANRTTEGEPACKRYRCSVSATANQPQPYDLHESGVTAVTASGTSSEPVYQETRTAAAPTAVEWADRIGFQRVLHSYLGAITHLPQVQAVFFEGTAPAYTRIWTIIDAPEFDPSYRRGIYQAQLDAIGEAGESMADFRVINRREAEGSLEDILPARRTVLFER